MDPVEQVESLRRSFTRIARFISQLMREQLSCGPVTMQQCFCLEALTGGPRSMKALAAEVGFHQTTVTRMVEKLEKQGLVRRERKPSDQRTVEVEMTEAGRETYQCLHQGCLEMTSALLALIPEGRRASAVEALELLANVLDPEDEAFQAVLTGCCRGGAQGTGDGPADCNCTPSVGDSA